MKNRGETEILHRVIIGELKLVEAAAILGYTARTVCRRAKRFRAGGEQGLVHGLIGRRSNRAKDEDIRNRAISLFREIGANTTLAQVVAVLREDGVDICRESLRRWLLESGLWTPGKKRAKAGKAAKTAGARSSAEEAV
jgi:transposase